jgi:hypothetical protein
MGRRIFSREFKRSAVKLVQQQDIYTSCTRIDHIFDLHHSSVECDAAHGPKMTSKPRGIWNLNSVDD